MNIKLLLITVSQLSILLPIFFGGIKLRFLDIRYSSLYGFVVLSGLVELVAELTTYQGNNFYVFHIDSLGQGITLIPFFYFTMQSKNKRYFLRISLILLFLIELLEIIVITGIYSYNSITRTYLSGVMSFLSFQYLHQLAKNKVLVDVHRHPMFWFCLAILMYFFANFLIFFFGYQLNQRSVLEFLIAHRLHLIILIISRVLMTIGFWRIPKTKHLWS